MSPTSTEEREPVYGQLATAADPRTPSHPLCTNVTSGTS
jgi:hypothetical protein